MEENDTGHVCWWAKMYSLVAKMKAIEATMEGMKATNLTRERQGLALAWDEGCFDECRGEFDKIAEELEKI